MEYQQIHWFPGHMQKAMRGIEEKLKLIDVVIEVCDARIPLSSRNPILDKVKQNKEHIILFTKSDLSDTRQFSKWKKHYNDAGITTRFIITNQFSANELEKMCLEVLETKHTKMRNRGLKIPALRAIIIGMPNVGKSTLINKLSKKNALTVGDRPGVTKSQQWIKVGKQFELLDTPGIMWPKISEIETALKIAATGAIKDSVIPLENVARFIFGYLICQKKVDRITDLLADKDFEKFLDLFCEKRKYFLEDNQYNYERAIETFIQEYRKGMYGFFILDDLNETT